MKILTMMNISTLTKILRLKKAQEGQVGLDIRKELNEGNFNIKKKIKNLWN